MNLHLIEAPRPLFYFSDFWAQQKEE
jgi:hypothetical protein